MDNGKSLDEPMNDVRKSPSTIMEAIEFLDNVCNTSNELSKHSDRVLDKFKGIRPDDMVKEPNSVTKERPDVMSMVEMIVALTEKIESNLNSTGNNVSQIQNIAG